MCGIIGIISTVDSKKLSEITASALKRLEYRGYDSVGVASLGRRGLEVRKAKGTVEEVISKKKITEMSGYIFLGHTRWATHGSPTDYNAHPHTDCSGKIAVIHNGTIKNFKELREELQSLGHVFKSETDTEVIPHLIEEFMKRGMDAYTAFKNAVKTIDGSYAILAIIQGEKRIFFAKKDNPLVIGLGEGENYIASDIPAFLPYTKRILILNDNELGYITASHVFIEDLNGNIIDVSKRIRIVDWDIETASKEGYPHFMLKEIHESPKAVRDTVSSLLSDLELIEKVAEEIRNAERVIVVGAGTSYHAGLYFSLLLNRIGIYSIPLIASEYYNIKGKKGDFVIAISQSGETIDVLQAIRKLKGEGGRIASITNVIESAIARESEYKIYMRAGPEIGVAATKTFTAQLVSLLVIYSVLTKENLKKFEKADEEVYNALGLESYAKKIGKELSKARNIYYLGRGLSLPLAMEGALKVKEVAYVHAEAYPAGESKHGPIALVEKGFPVVFINDGEMPELLKNNIMEMKARGAKTYIISTNKRVGEGNEVYIESMIPPLSIAPIIQLIAYYASIAKGINPDKPRNLAKTVTVE